MDNVAAASEASSGAAECTLRVRTFKGRSGTGLWCYETGSPRAT